ncbi:trigger factor [Oribacterium sp. C9]|uniref:trigger factor n=1 Tax=Oribacterium sp. C9 TaxID=1943579 RepID=UPI00098F2323|nr:trigger factor [Oribacterium sp. C9]OON88256.1 trigger factor [Oribacterium sp. C9]
MKKNKMVLAAAAVLTAASLAACGSGKTSEAKETTAASSATSSEIPAEDPAIAELEKIVVPDMPKLKDMGYMKMVDLKDITVEVSPKTVVDDAMVDSQISSLMSSYKDEVDEAAKEGDTVTIDFVGTVDGEEFQGGSSKNYDLTLGSGQFINGFEDQLIGSKKGDKVTVNVTFPENYGNEKLNGKPAVFEVTVNKVSRTAELSDEWLSKHGSDLETDAKTVADFREEQRALLQSQADYSFNSSVQADALQQIADKSEIGITTEMKDYAEAYVIRSEIDNASRYGYGLSDMLKMYGMTLDEFKEEMGEFASDYAKQRIIVATLAEEQGITATDELIDKLADKLSGLYGKKLNKIQLIEQFGGDLVKEEAVNDAVLEYIQSCVKVVEKEQIETEAETEEETEEEIEDVADRGGEGGYKTKKVTSVYEPVSTEAATEAAESESAAK